MQQARVFSAGRGCLQSRGPKGGGGCCSRTRCPGPTRSPLRRTLTGCLTVARGFRRGSGTHCHRHLRPSSAPRKRQALFPSPVCLPLVLFTFTDTQACDCDHKGGIQSHHPLPPQHVLPLTPHRLVPTHVRPPAPFLSPGLLPWRLLVQGLRTPALLSRIPERHPVSPPSVLEGLPLLPHSQGLRTPPPNSPPPQPLRPGCPLAVARPAHGRAVSHPAVPTCLCPARHASTPVSQKSRRFSPPTC